MSILTWPAFAKLQGSGIAGVGVNLLRSPVWSELDAQGLAQNNPLPIRLVGRCPSPPTSAPATDLWPAGGVRTLPTAAFTLAVSSDSATDSYSAATGAMVITVPYLDVNYTWHYAQFQLNGETGVAVAVNIDGVAQPAGGTAVTNAYRVLPWSFVSQSGTAAAPNTALNVGNLYVGSSAWTLTLGVPDTPHMFDKILAGDNRSNLGAFTVPAGMALILMHGIVASTQIGTTVAFGKAWKCVAPWGGALSPGVWTPAAAISPWQNETVRRSRWIGRASRV